MGEREHSFGDDVRAPESAGAGSAQSRFRLRLPSVGAGRGAGPEFRGDALAALYAQHRHRHDDDVSFGFLLRQSAAAIEQARALINARGGEIARAIAQAGSTDARLAAWGARLLIALLWVFIGIVLARDSGAGVFARGLDPGSGSMLARIFVGVGVLGAAIAMVGGFLAKAGDAISARSADFGAEAGEIVRAFGETAADLRRRIADEDDAAAASDLSRLHLMAVEAATFLEGINFLAEPDHERAGEKFRAFLSGAPAGRNAAPAAAGLVFLVLVASVGLAAATGEVSTGFPPWVAVALPGFAALYAGLGLLFAAAGADAAGGAAARARDETLTRLRKAYVAAGAPRADDIIEDVEAAIDAFQRRIGPGHHHSTSAGGESKAVETDRRRGAEAPRFVAHTFDAAPPVFRTERQANFRKNFFTAKRRNADPKQSPNAPDAPPWLKD
ncbi:MAG TPA: hypothetical protein PKH09_08805 [Parvularculaceae bacterium]|nr:hypothetical protein [Parvularculaceae bacterium]